MNKISEVTRRYVFDLFETGIILDEGMPSYDSSGQKIIVGGEKEVLKMSLYGRLEEISFLERLFPLDEMVSNDTRYITAREDIIKHTIANDDWPQYWIFTDNRFNLIGCEDATFLEFLCTVFHPVVRKNIEPWKVFLLKINELLHVDGYELVEQTSISGHVEYSWILLSLGREYQENALNSIEKFLDTDYVRMQISEMEKAVETKPYIAIGKAKELIETCCRSLLDASGIVVASKMDLPILFGITCEYLELAPNKNELKDVTHDNGLAKVILGNYIQIVSKLAELRNSFGDGHGRAKTFLPLPSRYARLAVGSAITVVEFMLSTYEDNIGKVTMK